MTENGRFDELLAVRVAAGSTVRDAAADVGCSERQAYRLSTQSSFRNRVSELRSEATAAAVGRLSDIASKAVDTLTELMGSQDPKIRLAAAGKILSLVTPLAESLELRQRIDELERKQN